MFLVCRLLSDESEPVAVLIKFSPTWDDEQGRKLKCRELQLGVAFTTLQLNEAIARVSGADVSNYVVRIFDSHLKEEYEIGESAVLGHDEYVLVKPRFFRLAFFVASWSVDFNRRRVMDMCKEKQISAELSRHQVNAIRVVLSAPKESEVMEVYRQLKQTVEADEGIVTCPCESRTCDDSGCSADFGFGSLRRRIVAHRATAQRNDGVPSWDDDEGRGSQSTHFVPLEMILR
jgi:hypothetical protein